MHNYCLMGSIVTPPPTGEVIMWWEVVRQGPAIIRCDWVPAVRDF